MLPIPQNTLGGYILIPSELCAFCLSNKLVRPLQLFIYLKSVASGKIKITRRDQLVIAERLNLKASRTVMNNLRLLLEMDWIGYNPNSRIYFIRSFDHLTHKYNFQSRTAAEFNINDISKFKGFLVAVVIGYLVNLQRRRRWLSERKKGRSNHLSNTPPKFYPIANKVLAKVFKVALSTACELKQLAHNDGFVTIRKNYRKTGIQAQDKNQFKKANESLANKVRVKNGELVLQEPDSMISNIRFKTRKKIETYKKG